MSLSSELHELTRASFAGLWVHTQEDAVALVEIRQLCHEQNILLATYDLASGVSGSVEFAGDGTSQHQPSEIFTKQQTAWSKSPTAFLRDIPAILPAIRQERRYPEGQGPRMLLVVLRNGHFPELVPPPLHTQLLANLIHEGKANDYSIAVLSPLVKIPLELERLFTVIRHSLPTKPELRALALEQDAEASEMPQDEEAWGRVVDAAAGLTIYEAENAYALSIIRGQPFNPTIIWDLKAQTLAKKGILKLYQGNDSFERVGGLSYFKKFATKLLSKRSDDPELRARGALLLGVPGGGKTLAARCLANATGRKVLEMNTSALRSKWQGETENNMLSALEIADSMQPCVLFVDEIEKALSGAGGSGETDGGTTNRVFGSLLTWLNDHTSDVFFIGTCNNIAQMPAEFVRAERFDGMFFFDLPGPRSRQAVWEIYLKRFVPSIILAPESMEDLVQMSKGWTPAEIKTCCRLAALQEETLEETAKGVTIVSQTAADKLAALREWASGKCRSVDKSGMYRCKDAAAEEAGDKQPKPLVKRKVHRDHGR